MGSSVRDEEWTGHIEPPDYSQSLSTRDSSLSFSDTTSARVESMRTDLRAQTIRSSPIMAGQVNVEVVPVYGLGYESTSDA